MNRLYLILAFAFLSISLFSQEDKKDKRKTEIGLNITNTLAGFFNSGGSGLSTDQYLLSLKFSGPNAALRFGTNFRTSSKSEFQNNGTRTVKENEFYFRGGFEFRKQLENRFMLYYGLDGVVETQFEEVNFNSFNFEDIGSKKTVLGFGGGPVLGFQFQLMKNIALSTEASIYGIIHDSRESQEVGSGIPPVESNTTGFRVVPAIPSSLYLIMIF